jgi:xylan 1,4-beta-xylosidase
MYQNPILGGDYPDPSVLRVGADYYMTHSSFNYAPGLLIWHSKDLVNWTPVCNALTRHDGDVWAPDLVQHGGRFYIYYKTTGGNHVMTAPAIAGPWTDPQPIGSPGHIDPGHIAGPSGARYVHFSAGMAARLSNDGLRIEGEIRNVYGGWPIPEDWRIQGFCLEGPKLFWKDGFCYLISAQGGTAGPATSHMVVAARAGHPMGPWENSPYNPLIHTQDRSERWWSQGHGTLIEAADGSWWCMLHAYEKGCRTLGRQTLLAPIEWTADGWPVLPPDFDIAAPFRKPPGTALEHGLALSDDFTRTTLGLQWRMWGPDGEDRLAPGNDGLRMTGTGSQPADSPPLCCIPVDHAYETEVDVAIEGMATAGLILYYNDAAYCGMALSPDGIFLVQQRRSAAGPVPVPGSARAGLRIVNDRNQVEFWYRAPGADWARIQRVCDTSGCEQNTFGGFLSLRIGLYCAGAGSARFRSFRYRGLGEWPA